MKTYTKTITQTLPRLVIEHDTMAQSPRRDTNLGYFITCERNYNSPDKNDLIERIVKQTGDEAQNVDEHMEAIKKSIKEEMSEDVIAIYPVNRYEHGNVVYRRGTMHGFDYSNSGFYIITNKTLKEYGEHGKPIEALIDGELEEYTSWANGEVYKFVLYDEQGEYEDSCGGFYDIDSIKEYLGKEWADEDLSDYIK